MAGYIKLYRGSRDTDGLMPSAHYSDWEAWTWLIENAAWKDHTRFNSKGEEVEVRRGDLHTSLASLARVFGWSIKRVRTFLTRLERVQKVTQQRAQSGTHLTICNYEKYQGEGHGDGHTDGHGRGTVGARSGHTQEEGKEGKEGKNTHYAFFGRVIRLNENDLARWRSRYHGLADIEGELGSLDDWLVGQDEKTRKGWFHVASGALNKKHQAAIRAESPDEEPRYEGP